MASQFYPLPVGGETVHRFSSLPKLPFSIAALFPHRLRRQMRSTKPKPRSRSRQRHASASASASSTTPLTTSLNPADTFRALRAHHWTYYDAQYLFLALLAIFSLSIIQVPGPLIKTGVVAGLTLLLLVPLTRQFFLPFLPIAAWLLLFYGCQFITGEYRPAIWVTVLPALENILYGANLSNILSAHRNTVLDVIAWLPYGITHFGAPFVCSGLMFIFAPPGTTPVFARAFGYMNITGVLIQILFPCSPPWYENMYGLAPANYSMPGSPAGLAAIDKLFGIDLYTSTFTASPMVFGAFPSLHSGSATIEALFMSRIFPRLRPLFIAYTLWLWWSTMYLSHHYAIDLVAGSIISAVAYSISEAHFLPRLQPGKMFRWDYDNVEFGEEKDHYTSGYSSILDEESYPMVRSNSDEWALGSSSTFSSSSQTLSTGMRSPTSNDGWDGDTLASASDGEHHKA